MWLCENIIKSSEDLCRHSPSFLCFLPRYSLVLVREGDGRCFAYVALLCWGEASHYNFSVQRVNFDSALAFIYLQYIIQYNIIQYICDKKQYHAALSVHHYKKTCRQYILYDIIYDILCIIFLCFIRILYNFISQCYIMLCVKSY